MQKGNVSDWVIDCAPPLRHWGLLDLAKSVRGANIGLVGQAGRLHKTSELEDLGVGTPGLPKS